MFFDKQELWEHIRDEECLIADGFDDAVIGIVYGDHPKTVYSVSKMLDILTTDEEMTREDAVEFFEYNIAGAYFGEKTPIYVYDFNEEA